MTNKAWTLFFFYFDITSTLT